MGKKVSSHLGAASKESRKKIRKTLGTLKSLTVQPKTKERYKSSLSDFFSYLRQEQLVFTSENRCDGWNGLRLPRALVGRRGGTCYSQHLSGRFAGSSAKAPAQPPSLLAAHENLVNSWSSSTSPSFNRSSAACHGWVGSHTRTCYFWSELAGCILWSLANRRTACIASMADSHGLPNPACGY